jgi:hypothetical protein
MRSAQQLRVMAGQDKLKVFRDRNTASGVALDRQFCIECGSNVFLSTAHPERGKKFVIVALGTLDQKFDWCKSDLVCAFSLQLISSTYIAPAKELFPEQKCHWVSGIHCLEPRPKL